MNNYDNDQRPGMFDSEGCYVVGGVILILVAMIVAAAILGPWPA
jgi:hypothetical protein